MDTRSNFPINLTEADHELVLHAPLPGTEPENIVVQVDNVRLTIKSTPRGSRQDPAKWYVREWEIGDYERTITLPYAIDSDHMNVTYKNGVLTISMARSAKTVKREIRLTQVGSAYGQDVGHSGHAGDKAATAMRSRLMGVSNS